MTKNYIHITLIDYYLISENIFISSFPICLSSIVLWLLFESKRTLVHFIFELNLAKLHQIDRLLLVRYLDSYDSNLYLPTSLS